MTTMRLNEIKRGDFFRVKKLDCRCDSISRLMSMGLLPDQEIRLVHEAPLGDPIAVEFNGCQVSLRLQDAAHVEVELIG